MSVSRVVLATGNAGKLRELRSLLAGLPWEVVPQAGLEVPEAVEDAPTFVENALLKARNAAACTGLPAMADDSGLVVDALNGAPGILSARFAGAAATDAQRCARLLEMMRGMAMPQRRARFVCLAVFLHDPADPAPLLAQGVWEGHIAEAPRGRQGFGYDPVFVPLGGNRTAAELTPDEKNRVSHRASALTALRAALVQRQVSL